MDYSKILEKSNLKNHFSVQPMQCIVGASAYRVRMWVRVDIIVNLSLMLYDCLHFWWYWQRLIRFEFTDGLSARIKENHKILPDLVITNQSRK